jgi:hypothetical protein
MVPVKNKGACDISSTCKDLFVHIMEDELRFLDAILKYIT